MDRRLGLLARLALVSQLSAGCGWVNRRLLDLDAGLMVTDAQVDEPDASEMDAGTSDAGDGVPDASQGVDAAVPADGGLDAGASIDAAAPADAGSDASVEAGPQRCNFAGTWVAKITIPTRWSGSTGIAAGSGTAEVWIKYQTTSSGSLVPASMVACGVTIPDFSLTPLLGGEHYGVDFDIPMFDAEPPRAYASDPVMLVDGGGFPGDPVTMSQTVQVLGTTLSNPLTDPWPSSPGSLANNDMDGDGKPGVTVPNLNDGTHVYMRVDALGSRRADRGYYASRVVMSWSGSVVSCDELAGDAEIPRFDTHFVGCRLVGGGECNSSQRNLLDDFRPIHMPDSAIFHAFKVTNGASCAVARGTAY